MTLFGKSLFENVLAGMDARRQDDEAETISATAVRGLNAGFVGRDFHGDHHIADRDPAEQFEDYLPEFEALLAKPQPEPIAERPCWLDRLSESEIAEDAGLIPGLTRLELQERRRAFARVNHPDRVSPEYRSIANLRMMVANQLIDTALKAAP